MAVAFDAGSEHEVNTGESLTIAHTCSGANRVLYAMVINAPGGTAPDGIVGTYAEVQSLDVLFTDVTTDPNRQTRVFRLVAPTTGTKCGGVSSRR